MALSAVSPSGSVLLVMFGFFYEEDLDVVDSVLPDGETADKSIATLGTVKD